MTNTVEMMRATIRRTWAGPKANPQSAWSKQNSPWINLPKGCGSTTLVHSTSGRKYGCEGFLWRSIGPLSGDRTVWNSCKMDPCTGRWRLHICWRLSIPGCIWKISIMRDGFCDSGSRCLWQNEQARFGWQGRREGEATRYRGWIWVSTWVTFREVTSPSWQIRLS